MVLGPSQTAVKSTCLDLNGMCDTEDGLGWPELVKILADSG